MRHVVQEPIESKPLSEPVLLILTSLAHPRHGYALLKDIETLSGGRVRMSTGHAIGCIAAVIG